MLHVKPEELFAQRMTDLADRIAPMDFQNFDLSKWARAHSHECATPSCIAGHATWMSLFDLPLWKMDKDTRERAMLDYGAYAGSDAIRIIGQRYLGLDDDHAQVLFVPSIDNLYHGDLEPDYQQRGPANDDARAKVPALWAARTLRFLSQSGAVAWTRCREMA